MIFGIIHVNLLWSRIYNEDMVGDEYSLYPLLQ